MKPEDVKVGERYFVTVRSAIDRALPMRVLEITSGRYLDRNVLVIDQWKRTWCVALDEMEPIVESPGEDVKTGMPFL